MLYTNIIDSNLDRIFMLSWVSTFATFVTDYAISSFLGDDVLPLALRGILNLVESVRGFFQGLCYIFNGASIIDNKYVAAQGHTFSVFAPGKKHHMIVCSQLIEELNRAPNTIFSLHAVAKDFLQPRDTMHGFEWSDVRGQEGTGFVRALRHVLTSQLSELRPAIYQCISSEIRQHLLANETEPGSGTFDPQVFNTAKTLVAKVNCLVFFGPRLTANPAFLQASSAFPHEAAFAAEIIRILPCKLTRWTARCFTRNYREATSFYALLHEEVQQRMQCMHGDEDGNVKCNDGLQWLIDTGARKQNWDIARMVGEVMGIWYGSVHTLSIGICFALLDLYSHGAHYVDPLRAELAANPLSEQPGNFTDLPLLDAFLKESARLSAFETTAVRRQALESFRFQNGLCVQKREWVCVPTRSMMRDEARVPNALAFDAWRHLSREDTTDCSSSGYSSSAPTKKQSFLTDYNGLDGDGTMLWGLARITCPGRYYAALVMKLVLGVFLEEYDVAELGIKGERSFMWRSTIVPKSSIRMRVTKRQ